MFSTYYKAVREGCVCVYYCICTVCNFPGNVLSHGLGRWPSSLEKQVYAPARGRSGGPRRGWASSRKNCAAFLAAFWHLRRSGARLLRRPTTAALLFEYFKHPLSASAPEGELLGIACGDVRARDGMCSTYSDEGEEQPLAVS